MLPRPSRLPLALLMAACLAIASPASAGASATEPARAEAAASKGYRFLELWDVNGIKWTRGAQLMMGPYYFEARTGDELKDALKFIAGLIKLKAAGPRRFSGPSRHALDVDARGNVFVFGSYTRKATPFGFHAFRRWKPTDEEVATPAAVAPRGRIYADDSDDGIDVVSARTGRVLRKLISWSEPWETGWGFNVYSLATDTGGNLYAGGSVDFYDEDGYLLSSSSEERILKISPRGRILASWPLNVGWAGAFTVGPSGNLYIGYDDGRIEKRSPAGAILAQWGGPGRGRGQFRQDGVADIAVDRKENVYAVDEHGQRVQKFSSTGRFLGAIKIRRSGRAGMRPHDVAVDRAGNVYVLGDLVYKFVPPQRARRLARCRKLKTKTKRQRKRAGRCMNRAMLR